MFDRAPKFFDKSVLQTDAVSLKVNRKVYHGWKEVTIKKELNALASAFNVSASEKTSLGSTTWRILPGDKCEVFIGNDLVLTGYVDTIDVNVEPNSKSILLSGRSLTQDLIDCSILTTNSQLKSLDARGIANKIVQPYGLSVSFRAAVGAVIPSFQIRQGETPFEALDRLAKSKKFLLRDSTKGNVIVEKVDTNFSGLQIGEGENIKSIRLQGDNSGRFSDYIVKSQPGSSSDLGLNTTASESSQATGKARDEGISRYRPLVVISESSDDNFNSKERAEYEARLRAARSTNLSIVLVGWYRSDSKLWDVNQLIKVVSPTAGISSNYLIDSVSYSKSTSGTVTTLGLIRKDAYDFTQKTVKKEDDTLLFLGQE